MIEARSDFISIPLSSWIIGVNSQAEAFNKRELRLRELNYSLKKANVILQGQGSEAVSLILFTCQFSLGTAVRTRFGMGIVTSFRAYDGIYQISLNFDPNTQKFMTAYMIAAELSPIYNKGAKGLLTSIAVPNMKDSKSRLKLSNNIVGAVVWSPYGLATVLYHRPIDDCIVVKLRWGATAYLRRKGKLNYCYLTKNVIIAA